MNNSTYLAVVESKNKKKEYLFGIQGYYEKKGEIEETWEISQVRLIGNRAFIFAKVRKINILMINDYAKNSLVWVYFNHKNIGTEQIIAFNHI